LYGVSARPLWSFNTLTREVSPFEPRDPPHVGVYSCGPTVYADQHIGNMRAYVFADTLKRTLRWKGYRVHHVINITDVGHHLRRRRRRRPCPGPPHERDRAERGVPRRAEEWVRWWLHGEFINLKGAKIAKSTGGGVLVDDLVDRGYHPLLYWYILLQAHYRSQIGFSWEALDSARTGLRRLVERCAAARLAPPAMSSDAARAYLDAFDAAVSDDLNTAKALAVVAAASRDAALPTATWARWSPSSTPSSRSASPIFPQLIST
jgi:cysteinyl-tRNA synthetase